MATAPGSRYPACTISSCSWLTRRGSWSTFSPMNSRTAFSSCERRCRPDRSAPELAAPVRSSSASCRARARGRAGTRRAMSATAIATATPNRTATRYATSDLSDLDVDDLADPEIAEDLQNHGQDQEIPRDRVEEQRDHVR